MQDRPIDQAGHSASPARTSRRAIVSWTAKLAGGAALAASVPGAQWIQLAAAQDDEIILTASASEVGARPGGAYANGAAARAVADYEGGVSTQGAGSVSPAPVAAGGPGSGAGPGDSSGAGPGDQTGTGGGGTGGGTGGGGGTGAGPGDSSGSGPGDQSGGGY